MNEAGSEAQLTKVIVIPRRGFTVTAQQYRRGKTQRTLLRIPLQPLPFEPVDLYDHTILHCNRHLTESKAM